MSISYRSVAVVSAALVMGGLLNPTMSAGATAAKSVLLGRSNKAATPTTLANSAGTPLTLLAKKGSAPLSVESTTTVKNLSADRLDGLSSGSFARSKAVAALVVAPSRGVPAVCPDGTILTGGGGSALAGSLEYSGPPVDSSNQIVPNAWYATGSSPANTRSFAVCLSLSGKPVAGSGARQGQRDDLHVR